ncbi:MAG: alpha/beta fold hydrolase [Actinomycetota bacterium]
MGTKATNGDARFWDLRFGVHVRVRLDMDQPPETDYASSGDAHIAYQVAGKGESDLVLVSEWQIHLDAHWEDPLVARGLRRLASCSRLILFDPRGFGLSDPLPPTRLPTTEEVMDDIRAVMDSAESKKAALLAIGDGAPPALLFAATHPHRVRSLVIVNGYARLRASPDYPSGFSDEEQAEVIERIPEIWGRDQSWNLVAPSFRDDPTYMRHLSRLYRQSVSPGGAQALLKMSFLSDVREALSFVACPTLILHRVGNRWIDQSHGRYMAEHIPNAHWVELPGSDHLWWAGDMDELLDEVEPFLTGKEVPTRIDRVLATVVFTDVVDSTRTAKRLGDARWRAVLESHDQVVRKEVERFGGREIKALGDGFLLLFDAPGRAVRCAEAIAIGVRPLGLQVRAGVHAGEVELRGEDIGGIAVHIGQRICALADADNVYVSSTVRDLSQGSDIQFEDLGVRPLRGLTEQWRIYKTEGP